jgi:multiple sugar transport system permease protein
MLFPMLWMLLLSFQHNPFDFSSLGIIFSGKYTIANYTDVFKSDSFDIYFLNSFFVAFSVTFGNVILCFITGYAFARKKFAGKKILFATILGVLIIPPHVIMIPLYRLMVEFDWLNTYFALIFPWLITPFGVFLVKQYLESVPVELEDAARIDGAGSWYILFRIVMPVSAPILTVLAIYIFLTHWNAFLFPFLFTNDVAHRTLPVGLTFYLGKQSIDWGHLMAGASVSALPILIIFIFFQKKIISGLTAGALKE